MRRPILNFEIQYLRYGTMMQKFTVLAIIADSGRVGVSYKGFNYTPLPTSVFRHLDTAIHKAVMRSSWEKFSLVDCLFMDMKSIRKQPMGRLVARMQRVSKGVTRHV